MKFVVRLKTKKNTLFVPADNPGYFSKITYSDAGVHCCFGGEPQIFPYLQAWFICRQMQKSGFNCCVLPLFVARFFGRLQLRRRSIPKWWRK